MNDLKRIFVPGEAKMEILRLISEGLLKPEAVSYMDRRITSNQLRKWALKDKNVKVLRQLMKPAPIWEQLQRQIEGVRSRVERLESCTLCTLSKKT